MERAPFKATNFRSLALPVILVRELICGLGITYEDAVDIDVVEDGEAEEIWEPARRIHPFVEDNLDALDRVRRVHRRNGLVWRPAHPDPGQIDVLDDTRQAIEEMG